MAADAHCILETERLWLREFCHADAEVFAQIVGDPEVMRFIAATLAPADAVRHLEDSAMADYRKHGFGRWAMVLKESADVIGFAGLKRIEQMGEVDLGFGMFPEYWGRGLAVEAGRAILSYGFETLGLARIIGLVDRENTRSIRALEKLGFEFEKMTEFRGEPTAQYVVVRL